MDNFAAAEKALSAMLNSVEAKTVKVDTKTGVVTKEERVDYRQVLIDFADEVPGRQKAVIKRMPLHKINNLIAVLHEFKDEARQVRMMEILALMEKDGVEPEELVGKIEE
ncbi:MULTISPECIES: hypothetical protein [Photobacterium]|uniref:hypothetical protein n=1 Tax=Photobacterium TaxID=657 RepID=UPI003D129AAA